MSGICAVWRKQDNESCGNTLAAVCGGLSLHASEGQQVATDGSAGVGVSARFASQQIHETPLVAVVCDADLHNEHEIDGLLGKSSGVRTTATAIAELYARYGSSCVERLRGAFSLIIWDKRTRNLVAATDRFAIHPLVYYSDGKTILVASRIDALLASGLIPRTLNPRGIATYLNYTVNLAPETMIADVKRLAPGSLLLATNTQTSCPKYWDMNYRPDGKADEELLSRQMESVVQAAIERQCSTDSFSRTGAYLSGGTDSSTVVGMMKRTGRGPVKTFSIGFKEERFNELEYARITAKAFHTQHHEYLVSAEDCMQALPDMVRCFDEPFGNSSAIPTFFCARLAASKGVGFLLAGDGGDELFGGNERYLTDKIFHLYQDVPRFLRKGLIEPTLATVPMKNGIVGRARSYVRRSNLPGADRFLSYNLLVANSPHEILEPDVVRALGSYSVLDIPAAHYAVAPAQAHLDRLLYVDVKVTLGDNDLLKVTRMSELAGIRSRFPFLDETVAEFSGLIPAGLKVKGFKKRYLFKRAFKDLLPIEVINKKKHGFGIPVAVWMKSHKHMRELTRDVLLSPRTYQRGYIRRSFVEDLFQKHEADETAFYGDTLWTFLTLELWFRQFMDKSQVASA